MHLADHSLRQRFGGVPEEIELLLDPGHAFWRLVFPQDFVVALPAAARFVHRADEAQPAAVGQRDHARLAMHEATDVVRRDPHGRLPVLVEKSIQPPVAFAIQQGFGLQTALVPAAQQLALAQLSHLQVVRVDVHVADDLDLRNLLQRFARYLEQRAGEIARDALVARGTSQMAHQKARIQPPSTRRKAPDAHSLRPQSPKRRFLRRARSTSAAARTSDSGALRSMKASMSTSRERASRKSAISARS